MLDKQLGCKQGRGCKKRGRGMFNCPSYSFRNKALVSSFVDSVRALRLPALRTCSLRAPTSLPSSFGFLPGVNVGALVSIHWLLSLHRVITFRRPGPLSRCGSSCA